jgi:predicted dehydrogenase
MGRNLRTFAGNRSCEEIKPVLMKTIHTALLSFGMSGRVFHAPFITLHQGFTLAGAWERSQHLIQDTYPDVCSYPTLEALLTDDSVELVVVNTPTYTHYEYAAKALEAGKHIIVEKAFTTTVAEAEALKRLAAKNGKQIAVFQNRRWDSDFLTVKSVIESGILGHICEMELHYDRFNLTLSPKKHKEVPNPGSGIVKDLGSHIIDQAINLFGMPASLFADLRITRPESVVDDYLDVLLMYPDLRIRLKAGYIVKEPVPSFIVHGTKGSFLKSRADVQETLLQQGFTPDTPDWGAEPQSEQGLLTYGENGETMRRKIESRNGNYFRFYEGVYDALNMGKAMPVTADDGIRVMKIIEAIAKSHAEKRVVDIH